MTKPLPGGNNYTAELCEAERDVHEAMSLMETIVKTVTLPAQALTLMLKVTFILFRALSSVQRAREISRQSRVSSLSERAGE